MQNNQSQASLYQIHEIRKLEHLAVSKANIEIAELMNRAGNAAFLALQARWPQAKKVIVVTGKGNNAGDGFVLAKAAKEKGFAVKILAANPITDLSGIAKDAALACQQGGVTIEPFTQEKLFGTDVIVDALLGIGLTGKISEFYQNIFAAINASNIPVLALDVPSGLDADTGNVLGCAIRAALTITFIGDKRGLFTGFAPDFCGEIICDSLALPENLFAEVQPSAHLLDLPALKKFLPVRARTAHKGNFGHVLVIGGDYGMGGAVRMAAEAAARSGAGLVSIATRPKHICAINAARPEIMCHGVNDANQLESLIEKSTAVVLGPGLGRESWGQKLWQKTLKLLSETPSNKNLIMDADALHFLAENKSQMKKENWILTPHPGEAAKLLQKTSAEIQADRFAALQAINENYGGICVLKGAGTLVGAKSKSVGVCAAGNPGMASGGMGDVLSGIIGGLVAQKLDSLIATQLATMLHATAADHAAAHDGGERGMLAMDLLPYLRKLNN